MSAADPHLPIVLVHGAWGCAAGWREVSAALREAGSSVVAVELPGHGQGAAPSGRYGLDDCAEVVEGALIQTGPALLVGHSMGGMVISAAAERRPDLVNRLLYVAAFLPRSGDSLLALKKREGETIGPAIRKGPVAGTTVLDPELAAPILFQDATEAQRAQGLALLRPQSNAVQTDRVTLTAERFGRVPRNYVLCLRDRTVTPDLQRMMVRESPVERCFTLDCGHFPQLTAASELARIVQRCATCGTG